MATSIKGGGAGSPSANYGSINGSLPSASQVPMAAPFSASRSLDNGPPQQWPIAPNGGNAVIFTPTSSSPSVSATSPLLNNHNRSRHLGVGDDDQHAAASLATDAAADGEGELYRVPSSCEVRGEYFNRTDTDHGSRSFLHSARSCYPYTYAYVIPSSPGVVLNAWSASSMNGMWYWDRRQLWRMYNTVITPLPRKRSAAGEVEQKDYPLQEQQEVVKELGHALLSVGLPLHTVQHYMDMTAKRFGLHLHVITIGNAIWAAFGCDSTCHLIQVTNPGMSLSKMVEMTRIAEDVVRAKVTPRQAVSRIVAVRQRPLEYSPWLQTPAFALMSGAAAPLFGGGWIEILVAFIAGVLVGILTEISTTRAHLARGYELIIGVISSVLAVVVNRFISQINVISVVLGGILWALPGLRLTLAMNHMSTGHTVTGTAGAMSAIVTCLNMGFGILAGFHLNEHPLFKGDLTGTALLPLPKGGIPIAMIVLVFPCMVLLDAKRSHLPQLAIGAISAYWASTTTAAASGTAAFGSWSGAFIVGCLANLYSRWTRYINFFHDSSYSYSLLICNPAEEISLFSICMLVPGSMGVRSIIMKDNNVSLSLFSNMIIVALALVAGLFTSNIVIVPPRMQ